MVSDSGRPLIGAISQTSIDYFDHYKRPPSRDSSIDRYTRAASRLGGGGGSRQPSVDRTNVQTTTATMHTPRESSVGLVDATTPPDRSVRAGSQFRGSTPVPSNINGSVPTGYGSRAGTPSFGQQPVMSSPTPSQPFEDVILRQRTLGQDIIPSLNQPKRTESLYLGSIKAPPPVAPAAGSSRMMMGGGGGGGGGAGGGRGKGIKNVPVNTTLQRKKSLPDVQQLPYATGMMSREEVSALGSARREEVRRRIDESERLRANPLLYLVSPQVKDWFSRQQLVLLVLIINVVFAIMFIKMLT